MGKVTSRLVFLLVAFSSTSAFAWNDRKDYYDDVVASVREAEALLILGPGEAQGEFLKRLQGKKLRGVNVELETADKMTDRQIAAKVGRHFAAPIDNRTDSSKSTAKKKDPQATPGKRTKKAGR